MTACSKLAADGNNKSILLVHKRLLGLKVNTILFRSDGVLSPSSMAKIQNISEKKEEKRKKIPICHFFLLSLPKFFTSMIDTIIIIT
jgi:hypothetical protein